MDIKDIYRSDSKRLSEEFKSSLAFGQNGLIGDSRENYLEKYLRSHLPKKIALGKGIILGYKSDEKSQQVDIVLYDNINCPSLFGNEREQLFPVESVLGVIEVKSHLSKTKLKEAIKNIASVKERLHEGSITRNGKQHYILGVVFAYDLSNNSLESLRLNMHELIDGMDTWLWPDLIVILNQGIIYRHLSGSFNELTGIKPDPSTCFWNTLKYKEDTLFEFFIRLNDFLSNMESENVYLGRYKDLPKRVGKHFVLGHDKFTTLKGNKVRLTYEFINKVYDYCEKIGTVTMQDILIKLLGAVPVGLGEEILNTKLFLYNPDNVKGFPFEELRIMYSSNDSKKAKDWHLQKRYLSPHVLLIIDGNEYWVPSCYIEENYIEDVE